MVKEVNPRQAYEMLIADGEAVVLDVRSTMEYEYVGHPVGAVNVPWKEPPDWQVDPGFVAKVRKAFSEKFPGRDENDLTVLAICRSGARSRDAAETLLREGFRNVLNIAEGFEGDKDDNHHRGNINGWRFHQLPWEQG